MGINLTGPLSLVHYLTTQVKGADARKISEEEPSGKPKKTESKKDGPIPVKPLEDLYKVLDKLSKELDDLNLFTIDPETKELKPKDNLTGDAKGIAEELAKSYNELISAILKDKKNIEKPLSFPQTGKGSKEAPPTPKASAKSVEEILKALKKETKDTDDITYIVSPKSSDLIYIPTENQKHKVGAPVVVYFPKELELVKDEKTKSAFQKVHIKLPDGKLQEGLMYKVKDSEGKIKQILIGPGATLSTISLDREKGSPGSELWTVSGK